MSIHTPNPNSSIPPHYFSPNCVLCLYLVDDLIRADQLVYRLLKQYGHSEDTKVNCSVLKYKDLKGICETHKVTLRDLGGAVSELNADYCSFANARIRNHKRVGRFAFLGSEVTVSNSVGWDHVGMSGHGGSHVRVVFGPHERDKLSCFDPDHLSTTIEIVSEYAEICHGLIDHDCYIANHHGKYYAVNRFPILEGRADAADAWGEFGGEDRINLIRDPREALIMGSHIVKAACLDTPEGLSNWRKRHGITEEDVPAVRIPTGQLVLYASSDITDFNRSVRNCEKTRANSNRIMAAMCADGFSNPKYQYDRGDTRPIEDQIVGG